ncbi:hypothetical protein EVAR_98573_1 [Eumeta japonica]|uniref:Uncharacterized protein n=1 Tax=Eumeta variegata TaxID=151549 RepID=A0A4C1YQW4_EUMVA|nr:hypothetical protein EVAR_98573_1 [Eumeta japonica]
MHHSSAARRPIIVEWERDANSAASLVRFLLASLPRHPFPQSLEFGPKLSKLTKFCASLHMLCHHTLCYAQDARASESPRPRRRRLAADRIEIVTARYGYIVQWVTLDNGTADTNDIKLVIRRSIDKIPLDVLLIECSAARKRLGV